MKLGKLFMVVIAFITLTMSACKNDQDGCTVCKMVLPIVADCEINVCPDGSSSRRSGGDFCISGETSISAAGAMTQQEKIDVLTSSGFTCE